MALNNMLEDRDFRRTILAELASGKNQPVQSCIQLTTTMLIRNGIQRDRAELYANAYIVGLMFGLGILGTKEEEEKKREQQGR